MIIKIKHGIGRPGRAMVIAASAVLGALLAAAPLAVDGPSVASKSALAVGMGNGNGGVGNGSGRGAVNGSLGGASADLGGFNSARADAQGLASASGNSPLGALADVDNYADLVAYRDAVAELQAYLDSLAGEEPDPAIVDPLQETIDLALADVIAALSDAANKELDADSVDAILTLLGDKLD